MNGWMDGWMDGCRVGGREEGREGERHRRRTRQLGGPPQHFAITSAAPHERQGGGELRQESARKPAYSGVAAAAPGHALGGPCGLCRALISAMFGSSLAGCPSVDLSRSD